MRIITTICWVITALVLAGLALWFITGTVFGFRTDTKAFSWSFGLHLGDFKNLGGPYELAGSYSVVSTGVSSFGIDWVSGDVTVKPYDGTDVQITEYAQRELTDDEKLDINTSGNTLTVKFTKQNNIINMLSKKLEVLLPRAMCESFTDFAIDSVSGGVNVSEIKADNFRTHTTSGNINVTQVTSRTLDVDSTSGTVTLTSAHSDGMRIKSTSGRLNISDAAAATISCNTSSGRIEITGAFDDVTLKSTSGRLMLDNSASACVLETSTISGSQEITGAYRSAGIGSTSGRIALTSAIVPESLKIHTTSGGINVTAPDEGAITVRHSSTSGHFSSDIPVIMQNGAAQFELSSTSGGIRIFALK